MVSDRFNFELIPSSYSSISCFMPFHFVCENEKEGTLPSPILTARKNSTQISSSAFDKKAPFFGSSSKVILNRCIRCFRCGEVGHSSDKCPLISFQIKRESLSQLCYKCGEPGHLSCNCPNDDKRICFFCHSVGHVEKRCPLKKKSHKEWRRRRRQEKSREKLLLKCNKTQYKDNFSENSSTVVTKKLREIHMLQKQPYVSKPFHEDVFHSMRCIDFSVSSHSENISQSDPFQAISDSCSNERILHIFTPDLSFFDAISPSTGFAEEVGQQPLCQESTKEEDKEVSQLLEISSLSMARKRKDDDDDDTYEEEKEMDSII